MHEPASTAHPDCATAAPGMPVDILFMEPVDTRYGRYHIDMVGTTLTALTIPTGAGFLSINHTIASVLFTEGSIQFQSLKMNAKITHSSV